MKLFLQENAKFSSAGGSAPRPPCLRRLGALPPNPQPLAGGGFAPRPPLASGGWGLRPQTPKTAPPLRISGYAPGYQGCRNPGGGGGCGGIVTNDKVFLTRSCDMCQFAKLFLFKAYFLNLNICQDLLIRTVLCFLCGDDAEYYSQLQ